MRVEQLTCAIGAELLDLDLADAIQDDGLFAEVRWRWKKNSIAIWDKRSTQHYAVMDYPPCHRKMERAGIIGDVPF
jgi:alpha-ketoglutarate-dependent taurine dioxygenase